ncbi:MAG: DUF5916 domain-containing protein [Bacteroidota bacterium]|nr:DUF5916 domain-containing protein [Bacteroidota bacterium]
MLFYKNYIFCVIYLFLVNILFAGSSPKNIVASRTNSSPIIDGLLDEATWLKAVPMSDFVQYDPVEGAEPTEKTTVRVLYDDYALYFGVICSDANPEGIRKQLTRRDRSSEADRFSITIDSYNDGQTGFVFAGTVSGVQSDGVLYHDGAMYDIQWDAVWNYAAKINSDGWSAEFELPFSALRFTNQEGEIVWGINFRRYIARKKEFAEWVMIPRRETGRISKIGNLSGIIDIKPSLHLSVLPYAVSHLNFDQQQKPHTLKKVFYKDVGVDIKYGITNNFTVDAAINPDFGQVEVDQEVMNLTVFETIFPEKRPFFLEGSHIFSFGVTPDQQQLNLFYSRRIGRVPRYNYIIEAYRGFGSISEITNLPKNTTIIGAAKLTGRTESGLTVGALSTVTEGELAVYKDLLFERKTKIVEPRANYNVLRLSQDVLTNSSIGFMATSAFLDNQSPNISGGADWNLRFFDNTYAFDGYLTGSQFSARDDFLRYHQKYHGSAGKLFFGKIAGENWLYNTSFDFASKKFNINELGLYNRPREFGGRSHLVYKDDQAEGIFLRYLLMLGTDYRWNYEAYNTSKNISLASNFILKNFWSVTLHVINELPAYQGEERGIIGLYKKPSVLSLQSEISSDTRMPVSFKTHLIYEVDSKSKKEIVGSLNLTLRPLTWLEFVPMFTFAKRWKEETGVFLGGSFLTADDTITGKPYTLFGDRDLDYFDVALRGIITLRTNLSLQYFTQVFLYKWHYRNFKKIIDPDHLEIIDYNFYFKNLTFKALNANIVVRWEFLPGSTLFFAWTQARQNLEPLFFSKVTKDFSNAFDIPPDNVFLLKLNYWLNL